MMKVDPWQIPNVPGPKTANVISNPKIVSALLKRKRSLIIVGHEAIDMKIDGEDLIDILVQISRKIPVVATGHTVRAFISKGTNVENMGLPAIIDRLGDQMGFDGKGPYDLVAFIGVTYYLESQMLSHLRHFVKHLQTISINRFYQPNADWSFPNLEEAKWSEAIKNIFADLLR